MITYVATIPSTNVLMMSDLVTKEWMLLYSLCRHWARCGLRCCTVSSETPANLVQCSMFNAKKSKIFSSFDLDVASSGIVVGDVYWVAVGLILTDWYLGGNYVCYLIEKFRFFTQSSWACLDWVTPAWPSLDFHSVQDKLNSSKLCLHTTHFTFFRCPSITSLQVVMPVSEWGVPNFFVRYWIKGFQTSDLKLQD